MKRVTLKIYGRVQGVFFRRHTARVARQLDLTGQVQNEPDGTVGIAAEGPQEKLEKLISWCKKGSPAARVTKVNVRWQKYSGEFNDFRAEQ